MGDRQIINRVAKTWRLEGSVPSPMLNVSSLKQTNNLWLGLCLHHCYSKPFVVFAFYGALHELNFYENEHVRENSLVPAIARKNHTRTARGVWRCTFDAECFAAALICAKIVFHSFSPR